MTPAERQLVTELFDRLATLEDAPRDPEAERLIKDGLRQAPNAIYALVQTTLVQDEALKRADARIRELEAEFGIQPEPPRQGGFLDNMRDEHLRPAASNAARCRTCGRAKRRWARRPAIRPARRPQAHRAAAAASAIRRRLVPRHGSGRGRRRDRRLAAAEQHPRDDGTARRRWRPGHGRSAGGA